MRRYAFFDMDETVSRGHSMIDFALFLAESGFAPSTLTVDVAQLWEDYAAGGIDYPTGNDRLVTLLSGCLAGKRVAEVRQWSRTFAAARASIFAWVEPVFAFLQRSDVQVWLLSASLAPCVEAIARQTGVARFRCARLDILDGRYTGRVTRRVPPEQKGQWARSLCGKDGAPTFTIGVGDSTGDVDMLATVDRAFVINAHQPELLRLARQQGWCVTSPLTILDDVRRVLGELERLRP